MKKCLKIFVILLSMLDITPALSAALPVCTTSRNGKHLVVVGQKKTRIANLSPGSILIGNTHAPNPAGFKVPISTDTEISKCVDGNQQTSEKRFSKCQATSNLSGCKVHYDNGSKVYICNGANQIANNIYEFSSDPNKMCASDCAEYQDFKGGRCIATQCNYKGKLYNPGTTITEGPCMSGSLDEQYIENNTSDSLTKLHTGGTCQLTCHKALKDNNRAVLVETIKVCDGSKKKGVPFNSAKQYSPALPGYKTCVSGAATPASTLNSAPSSSTPTTSTSSNNSKKPSSASTASSTDAEEIADSDTNPTTYWEDGQSISITDFGFNDSSLDFDDTEEETLPDEVVQYMQDMQAKSDCDANPTTYWEDGKCISITDFDFDDSSPYFDDTEEETFPDAVLQYDCEHNKKGTKWVNGECVCANSNQELKGNECVNKGKNDKKLVGTPCSVRNGKGKYNDAQECIVESCDKNYDLINNVCTKKDKKTDGTECAIRHGTGKYDANRKCIPQYCDDGYTLNDKKTACVKKTESAVKRPNQTDQRTPTAEGDTQTQTLINETIARITADINAGVKVGDEIRIDKSIRYEKALEKIISQWEQACEKAQKPANAKTISAFVKTDIDLVKDCKIKECQKNYKVSNDEMSCIQPNEVAQDDKAKACNDQGGEYKAGSCWCKSIIMNPSKSKCVDGKIVKPGDTESQTNPTDDSETDDKPDTPTQLENDDDNTTSPSSGNIAPSEDATFTTNQNDNATQPTTIITVSGTVTDDKTNDGIKKATITVQKESENIDGLNDTTNGRGKFKIKDVPSDATLYVTADGYEPKSVSPITETMNITLKKSANDTASQSGDKPVDTRTDEEKAKALAEKQEAYNKAKETEQSKENRLLTSTTMAATGIGGMELAQGLAEQRADKVAEQSMNAYTSTMRCRYGNGKQVKAGPEEIELPGGNDENMTKLRNEYFALAADLKERKEALGMKPGIESETILDKSQIGLYDEENIGITDGAYASLYRANMLNSEKDKQLIEEEKETSQNRVIGGATTAGAGVVGGIVGDSLINGSLGDIIKSKKGDIETISVLDGGGKKLTDILSNTDIKTLFQNTKSENKLQ